MSNKFFGYMRNFDWWIFYGFIGHDIMYICGIDHNAVSDEDIKTLDRL